MSERPLHKRSKSALALSILHRDKLNGDDKVEDASSLATSDLESPTAPADAQSPTTTASPTHLGIGRWHSSRRKRQPAADAVVAGGPAASTAHPMQDGASGSATTAVPQSKAMSIEQSVRIFRLFEALRAGDTVTISKAIGDPSMGNVTGERSVESATSITSRHSASSQLEGTTVLHLAVQCAEPRIVEYVISHAVTSPGTSVDLNARDRDGNTPLHLAAMLGRAEIVQLLLEQDNINEYLTNYQGRTPLDLARNPDIFQQLQLSRSLYVDTKIRQIQTLVGSKDYDGLETLLNESRTGAAIDLNATELCTDPLTVQTGGTLLHEAAKKQDTRLIQILLMHGVDPFRRDRKGKLAHDITKDERTRGILKKSPAAVAAQKGIQEKAILGNNLGQAGSGPGGPGNIVLGGKDSREMKGYLKKWTNYTSGYKLRWFVLEDGVLSYYKHQDDAGSACRGAINMRIAKLHIDPQDKTKFEIQGKSSVKYHLKANHVVEAKRWFWALNNAIQWSKDEAKEEEKKKDKDAEMLRQARLERMEKQQQHTNDTVGPASLNNGKPAEKGLTSTTTTRTSLGSRSSVNLQGLAHFNGSATADDGGSAYGSYEPSLTGYDLAHTVSNIGTTAFEEDVDEEHDYDDDASIHELKPTSKDAFSITAQSARIQLDLLTQVMSALQAERSTNPELSISDPTIVQVTSAYEAAVRSLRDLLGDLLKISRDRDSYWQYRLDREINVRRLWEDSMARVAKEQEELENQIGISEDKRKRTKRALRQALEGSSAMSSRPASRGISENHDQVSEALRTVKLGNDGEPSLRRKSTGFRETGRRKSVIADLTNISDSESENDEEFFDAVDAGEVEVIAEMPVTAPNSAPPAKGGDEPIGHLRESVKAQIAASFKGYEDPLRKRLTLKADDRPKISLWGILRGMIGQDMSKMTLPVSFNEPTSLLNRVAEDMEYTDLLDTAADRGDSTERMVYVAAFAASEYASTIGRVAKPFNPLLSETYEYVRPDKGYRFFIEQVSHHPPIGAAWAESPKWDYYGESAVKSKFYGKSFDINPLGTWFLKLRPASGGEELYTWKKVTSSVVGIITGSPTVDNYGPMEIKNWTTGEVCILDFKPRGWKASSAYQVTGKVITADGKTRWSIGGRWNDKIYARLTPGYEGSVTPPPEAGSSRHFKPGSTQAFLVWQASPRPTGIPFNLTPFVVTLNALPDKLRPLLPPTDTRLRPDQRAMENGKYDFAAVEKTRLEEKQRAKRREREANGEEYVPKWFSKGRCAVTGEEYWVSNGRYWQVRDNVANGGTWEGVEDIF